MHSLRLYMKWSILFMFATQQFICTELTHKTCCFIREGCFLNMNAFSYRLIKQHDYEHIKYEEDNHL